MTDALDVLHGLVLDDGRRWGEAATAWQLDDAAAVLDPVTPPHLHFLTRPKGGSKSTDLGGVACSYLLTQAPPVSDAYAVAADHEQANRLLDRARGLIHRTPGLRRDLTVEANRIVGPNGARVHALAADVAGAEGLLTPFIVIDELPNWADTPSARAMWEAVISAIPKWPGMRLVVIGHAGAPEHWSYKILERARRSTAWRVNEVSGPLPWVSPEALEEQRHLLTPSQFARRHLNRWTTGEDRLATLEDVRACAVLDGPQPYRPGNRYAVGVDLGLKRDRAVAVVAHLEPGEERWEEGRRIEPAPLVSVDRKLMWRPSRLRPVDLGEVEDALLMLHETYGGPVFHMDPWQGAYLGQRLRRRGVEVVEFAFSSASVGRLAASLFGLFRDRRLQLDAGDEEMLDELSNVQLVERSPGTYRLDTASGRHDDQAVALALAAVHLLATPEASVASMWHYTRADVLAGRGGSSAGARQDQEMLRRMVERGDPVAIEMARRGGLRRSRRAR